MDVNRLPKLTPDRRPILTPLDGRVLVTCGIAWHGGQAASERALKERCSERAACDGQVRLLNRQLSLPVSMISQ